MSYTHISRRGPALTIHAGKKALEHMRSHGLQARDIAIIPAAAGGPKGLVLQSLDQWLFGRWLAAAPRERTLIGSSIGAWRMAAASHADPAAAFQRLGELYCGHGKRYNRETLEVHYKGKNITEVLGMTVEEAHEFFKPVPVIARKLQTLLDVGLGYIRLGQSATTLSGGEAQRVKLSLELSKRDTGRTLYILDEPTTGLHFHDIDLLLKVIHRLRDQGNTVVIIEHNLDVIKTADWIVDLGPEGGAGGGQIIAAGTPEDVGADPASVTGKYLLPLLKKKK